MFFERLYYSVSFSHRYFLRVYLPLFFFFNDPATTEIYTLSYTTLFRSLVPQASDELHFPPLSHPPLQARGSTERDRKSTRLNSSHTVISYAVFCLKKKKTKQTTQLF